MSENDDQGAENAFTMSFILRNFKPVDEFVIQWDSWTFSRNDGLDPKKLKEPGTTKKYSEEQLLAVIGDQEWGYSELYEHLAGLGIRISETTFRSLLRKLKNSGGIYKSALNQKWSKTASELEKAKNKGEDSDV